MSVSVACCAVYKCWPKQLGLSPFFRLSSPNLPMLYSWLSATEMALQLNVSKAVFEKLGSVQQM
jgi:hypothetical protein